MKFLFNQFEKIACQILLVLFVSLLFLQVVLRVIFNHGYPWMEELSRFAFVWFVFLGASYGAQKQAHNRVTVQLKKLSKKIRTLLDLITDGIWVVFNTLLTYKALEVIILMFEYTYHSPALDWSMAYLYFIFPLSFTLMSIRIVQYNYIRFFKNKDIETQEGASL